MAVPLKAREKKRGTPRLPKGERTNHSAGSASGRLAGGVNPAEKAGTVEIPAPPLVSSPFDRRKERTVTVKEAAYRLGKTEATVYLWLQKGRLKGWQPGGRRCWVQVSEASLEEALLCLAGGRVK